MDQKEEEEEEEGGEAHYVEGRLPAAFDFRPGALARTYSLSHTGLSRRLEGRLRGHMKAKGKVAVTETPRLGKPRIVWEVTMRGDCKTFWFKDPEGASQRIPIAGRGGGHERQIRPCNTAMDPEWSVTFVMSNNASLCTTTSVRKGRRTSALRRRASKRLGRSRVKIPSLLSILVAISRRRASRSSRRSHS